MADDAAVFDAFMEAYKLPKDDPEKKDKIQAALKKAAEVPLETAKTASAALRTIAAANDLSSPTVVSDMKCARHLLRATIPSALENVKINLGMIKDADYVAKTREEIKNVLKSICQ